MSTSLTTLWNCLIYFCNPAIYVFMYLFPNGHNIQFAPTPVANEKEDITSAVLPAVNGTVPKQVAPKLNHKQRRALAKQLRVKAKQQAKLIGQAALRQSQLTTVKL